MELFIYGSLTENLERITGKNHTMKPAILTGYTISGNSLIKSKGSSTRGRVALDVTQDDIVKLDFHGGKEYTRILERVEVGKKLLHTFVYMSEHEIKENESQESKEQKPKKAGAIGRSKASAGSKKSKALQK